MRAPVAIDGPNHGIIDCSPNPANFYQLVGGGFTPSSAVCDESGSDHTQLLTVLNAAGETTGPTRYLVIRNKPGSPDFVYNSLADGAFLGVPAEDRDGSRMISPKAPVSPALRQSTLSTRGNSTASSAPAISGSRTLPIRGTPHCSSCPCYPGAPVRVRITAASSRATRS